MNNFDQSSSGVNLDLLCFYDSDLASLWFNDELSIISVDDFSLLNERYSGVNIYQLTCGGELEKIDLADFGQWKITKKNLLTALRDHYTCIKEVSEQCKYYLGKSLSRCTKSDLFEFIENDFYDRNSIIEFLRNNFTPKFDVVSSLGHCQGDYVEIIIPKGYYNLIGSNPENARIQEQVDRLLWDRPVYCRLNVDDQEICFDKFTKNCYNWDKDEILTIAEKEIKHSKKDYILNWLKINLPDSPHYN